MKNNFLCLDCGKDTSKDIKDYYMITHKLWKSITPYIKGMLCMDCLEIRLGRKLKRIDILDCPLTRDNPYTANLLK